MTRATDIEQQAAEWLVRRDAAGESDKNENRERESCTMLAADPRHRAAYLRLAAAWERSARLRMLMPETGRVDPDLLARGRGRWGARRPLLAMAAGFAAVAIAAGAWLSVSHGVQTFRTDLGGLSRVVLKDGSTITLNTDTNLRVHFGDARREVELLHGEAQFSVAHDTARPFEVSVGSRVVRAVGTAFDVRLDHGNVLEVTVTQGRVAIIDATAAANESEPVAMISAGESVEASDGKFIVRHVSATEASRHLAWQAGNLSFQGETLATAVAEFNRYNRRKLKVDDPSIADLQIGGDFQALDVDSFIAALERSFGIVSRRTDDGTLVLERARARASQINHD